MNRLLQYLAMAPFSSVVLSFAFAAPVDARELSIGHINAVTHPSQPMLERFAELIEERTDGEYTVRVYPNGELGGSQELQEGVRFGTVDMAYAVVASLAEQNPYLSLLEAPYLFTSEEQANEIIKSNEVQAALDKLAETAGIRVLAFTYFGSRHLTANSEINSPEDLSELQVRAISFPIYIETVAGLGANAVPLPFGELYTALQTGTVDGQENPLPIIYTSRFHEVQDYLMLTGHMVSRNPITINEALFQRCCHVVISARILG